MKSIDLTGQRFGRWVVTDIGNGRSVPCICDCGKEKLVDKGNLTGGITKSCGCYKNEKLVERSKTHQMTRSREYSSWAAMKNRCLNPKGKRYKDYGGNNITVCDRWINSFEDFYSDMGPRPLNCTLDRKDNTGSYTKDNCRWATKNEQARNKSTSRLFEYNGSSLTAADWSDITGLPAKTIYKRIVTFGWTIERAITQPLRVWN